MDALVSPNKTHDWKALVCPFLSLPGELRNRIYHYCVETGPITLHPAHRRHRHVPSPVRFGGLRYVCKTLYIEFTPIYLTRTVVSLQPSDVERYLYIFYPRPHEAVVQHRPTHSDGLPPNIHGNVLINLRLSEVLDLTPLAGLLSRAPKIRIAIAQGAAINPMMSDGRELLRTVIDSSCSIDFRNTVERLLFRYFLSAEIVVRLHRGVLLEELFGNRTNRNPRQWLAQQGIPVLSHLKIVLEASEGILRDEAAGWLEALQNFRQHPVQEPNDSSQKAWPTARE